MDLSLVQVLQEAARLSDFIISTRTDLLRILDAHEELLHERWARKSTKQRKAILVKARPDIPVDTHTPRALPVPIWQHQTLAANFSKSHR